MQMHHMIMYECLYKRIGKKMMMMMVHCLFSEVYNCQNFAAAGSLNFMFFVPLYFFIWMSIAT